MSVNVVPGACAPVDPHCIQVRVANPPNNPAACAQTVRNSPGPDGVTTRGSDIYVHPAYTGWTPSYLNWLMNHEFGHLFGLRNSQNCAPKRTTVMAGNDTAPCGTFPASYSATPTPSDATAVARTAYGQESRKTCGVVP